MKTNENFLAKLNSLNSAIGVNSAIGNKYDYERLEIPKSQQLSFRKKIRKLVCSIYEQDKIEKVNLQAFADYCENALLICTKDKKKFVELSISSIYPSFEKCSSEEKEKLTVKHKQFISILTEKEKSK